MNVLHIGTSDNSGGAARAAFRLHLGLSRIGVSSHMLVGYQTESRPEIDHIPKRNNVFQKVVHAGFNMLEQKTGLQYLLLPWKRQFLTHPFTNKANVINLHNLHGGFFSYTILPALSQKAPIVWTLHDPWVMTGHCGYPSMFDCERWKTGCGECPALSDYPPIDHDTTAYLWRKKQRAYHASDITVVAPTNWLADTARQSPLLNRFEIVRIPYGVDTEIFTPMSKIAARESVGLPKDAKIVLFSAHGVENPRKGARYLVEALKKLSGDISNLLLVTIGDGKISGDELGRIRTVPVSFVNDDSTLIRYYGASDVYALPTLADNMPNGILESMACGRPVVAFNTGGVPDMVTHNETGYLAAKGDVDELAHGLRMLLSEDASKINFGERAREVAEQKFGSTLQAERYRDLYEEVILRKSNAVSKHYSFRKAADYWFQVPAATYKIDTRKLAHSSSEVILAEWEHGLRDYLGGWRRNGYLPLLEEYREAFRGKTILEIGCGLGFEHIHFFSPVVQHSLLCDIVPSNIDVVNSVLRSKRLNNSEGVLIDYERELGFPRLDFVYSHGVLHHIPFQICRDQVVPRFGASLKAHGKFIVMLYTEEFCSNVRATSLADFAAKTEKPTEGAQNLWSEPYNAEKVGQLFGNGYCLLSERLYNNNNFVMFELEKIGE